MTSVLLRSWLARSLYVLALLTLQASAALAQGASPSEADVLFQAGKDQLAQGHYPEACLLLSRSYDLAPATGSLLAVALCREKEGRLASAQRAYAQAAERSRAAGQLEREQAALRRVEELAPRLSTLTIALVLGEGQEVPVGLRLEVDEVGLDASQLGKALPFDGGAHRVRVHAPGHAAFETSVVLAPSADAQRLEVPGLAAATVVDNAPVRPAAPQGRARLAFSTSRHRRSDGPLLTPLQWVGLSGIALGAGSLLTGLVYTLRAVHQKHLSEGRCEGNLCSIEGREDRIAARRAGDVATATLIGGAALVTGGVLAAVLGRRTRAGEGKRAHALRVAPWASPSGSGATLQGRF